MLRSKKRELVGQEWWGTLLACDLIREEMRPMAGDMKVCPQRLSFARQTIAITTAWTSWPLDEPEVLLEPPVVRKIACRYLPSPRRPRRCPRVVTQGNRTYPTKMPVCFTDWHWPRGRLFLTVRARCPAKARLFEVVQAYACFIHLTLFLLRSSGSSIALFALDHRLHLGLLTPGS